MLIRQQFGTFRGLVRLALSYLQVGLGLAARKTPEPTEVQRLVFICHGNICRSAFADVVARKLSARSVSFGLSTASGKGANAAAMQSAKQLGVPMDHHITTDISDFEPQAGDYLLAMEVRQLHRLAAHPSLSAYPRGLLGSYCTPPIHHLHDPYQLDLDYMDICLKRIERAVEAVTARYPRAKAS